MRKITLGLLASGLALAIASPAMAHEQGSFTVGAGLGVVSTKSNNGDLNLNAGGNPFEPITARAKVSNDMKPTVTFEYFVMDNLGIEVLAAWPFEHDIKLNSPAIGFNGLAVRTKQLPPVVSLQYHFANSSKFTPFVGLGINYTKFYNTTAEYPGLNPSTTVDGNGDLYLRDDVKLKNSVGIAAHLGVDYAVTDTQSVRVDARWIDIDTDVRLNGQKIGKANIDPIVYGASYVWKF